MLGIFSLRSERLLCVTLFLLDFFCGFFSGFSVARVSVLIIKLSVCSAKISLFVSCSISLLDLHVLKRTNSIITKDKIMLHIARESGGLRIGLEIIAYENYNNYGRCYIAYHKNRKWSCWRL